MQLRYLPRCLVLGPVVPSGWGERAVFWHMGVGDCLLYYMVLWLCLFPWVLSLLGEFSCTHVCQGKGHSLSLNSELPRSSAHIFLFANLMWCVGGEEMASIWRWKKGEMSFLLDRVESTPGATGWAHVRVVSGCNILSKESNCSGFLMWNSLIFSTTLCCLFQFVIYFFFPFGKKEIELWDLLPRNCMLKFICRKYHLDHISQYILLSVIIFGSLFCIIFKN